MRVTRCSTTWSEAFLAALRVLLVLRVAGSATSLLLVLLSHKCNEASFFVPCAALLPHGFPLLSEHPSTTDTAVGFGLLPRERRRFGYESKSVVILFCTLIRRDSLIHQARGTIARMTYWCLCYGGPWMGQLLRSFGKRFKAKMARPSSSIRVGWDLSFLTSLPHGAF